jgi:hypothetical protein
MPLLSSLVQNPRYALVRGIGRFSVVRNGVTGLKRLVSEARSRQYERELGAKMPSSLFSGVDRDAFLAAMKRDGCAFGLTLPARIVDSVTAYAESNPVFAFREEKLGFAPLQRTRAQAALGREILLAQYYNTLRNCPAVAEVASDPLLNWIALKYLGSVPVFLGCNLWWTYPVTPNLADQIKHAHFFHRDIDDFRFIKFFFYMSDVASGDGAHWLVAGSHAKAPHIQFKDYFLTRRFSDSEIAGFYGRPKMIEVVGQKGTGLAEDTLCLHKGATPSKMPRLILQLQFALFDLGVGDDRRDPSQLAMIDGSAAAAMQ